MVTRLHNNRERVVLSLIYQLVPIRHPSRQKIKLQKYIYIRTKMSKDVNECIMSMNVAANLYIGLSMLSGPKRVAPTQTALDRFIRFCRAHRCAQRADRQQHGPRLSVCSNKPFKAARIQSRSSAIAEGPRDASCQLKSCQLPRNSAETTYTTSPDQIDGMKSEM